MTFSGLISSFDCFLLLQSEHSMALRDLTMQIEIANAQATEFEESAQQLNQEIKDLGNY